MTASQSALPPPKYMSPAGVCSQKLQELRRKLMTLFLSCPIQRVGREVVTLLPTLAVSLELALVRKHRSRLDKYCGPCWTHIQQNIAVARDLHGDSSAKHD